jgi:hypothetical protein
MLTGIIRAARFAIAAACHLKTSRQVAAVAGACWLCRKDVVSASKQLNISMLTHACLAKLMCAAAAAALQIMGFLETKRYQGFKETGSVSGNLMADLHTRQQICRQINSTQQQQQQRQQILATSVSSSGSRQCQQRGLCVPRPHCELLAAAVQQLVPEVLPTSQNVISSRQMQLLCVVSIALAHPACTVCQADHRMSG